MAKTIRSAIKHLKASLGSFIESFQEARTLRAAVILNLKTLIRNIRGILQELKQTLSVAKVPEDLLQDKEKFEEYKARKGFTEEDITKDGYVRDFFLIPEGVVKKLPIIIERVRILISQEKKEKKIFFKAVYKIKIARKKEKKEKKIIERIAELENAEDAKLQELEKINIEGFSDAEEDLHKTIINLYRGHKVAYKYIKDLLNESLDLFFMLKHLNDKVQTRNAGYAEEIRSSINEIKESTIKIKGIIVKSKKLDSQFGIEVIRLRQEVTRIVSSVGAAA